MAVPCKFIFPLNTPVSVDISSSGGIAKEVSKTYLSDEVDSSLKKATNILIFSYSISEKSFPFLSSCSPPTQIVDNCISSCGFNSTLSSNA